MTYSCGLGASSPVPLPREAMKAIVLPSGDQEGCDSPRSPKVSCRAAPPVKGIIHRCERRSCRSPSAESPRALGCSQPATVYRMRAPLGDVATPPTCLMRIRSSASSGRRACAASGSVSGAPRTAARTRACRRDARGGQDESDGIGPAVEGVVRGEAKMSPPGTPPQRTPHENRCAAPPAARVVAPALRPPVVHSRLTSARAPPRPRPSRDPSRRRTPETSTRPGCRA